MVLPVGGGSLCRSRMVAVSRLILSSWRLCRRRLYIVSVICPWLCLSRRELWRGREVGVVASVHVVDFHGSRQANLGKQQGSISYDDPATYLTHSFTYLLVVTPTDK